MSGRTRAVRRGARAISFDIWLVGVGVLTMLVTALAMGDSGTETILDIQLDTPLRYGFALTLQVLVGGCVAGLTAAIVAVAGALLRWARDYGQDVLWRQAWQGVSVDAAVVAILVAGLWLGSAKGEIFRTPSGSTTVEIRRASRVEAPLGINIGSHGISPVVVLFRTRRMVVTELGYTFDDVRGRTWSVRFSKSGSRALVQFNGIDLCLMLPHGSMTGTDLCPGPDIIRAFLEDEPTSELVRRYEEDREQTESETPPVFGPDVPAISLIAKEIRL